MKPKHKFNLIIALVSVSILITLTGIAASVHHCIKWADYCKNENLSATVVEFSQNMIFHAYYWMGIAFACISLMATMALWYFSRQQNLHPKQKQQSHCLQIRMLSQHYSFQSRQVRPLRRMRLLHNRPGTCKKNRHLFHLLSFPSVYTAMPAVFHH